MYCKQTENLARNVSCGCRTSLASTLSEEVESMSDKLNALEVEGVVQHLRETLEEEVEQLLGDITFLQNCLDEEADLRCGSSMRREPTLTELREERTKLERDLLSPDADVSNLLSEEPVRRISQVLKPSSGKLRPPSSSTSSHSTATRAAPLKASHQICSEVAPSPPHNDKNLGGDQEVHRHSYRHHLMNGTSDNNQLARVRLKLDSSDLGHLCKQQTSHIKICTGPARVVQVARVTADEAHQLVPSPPSSAKPAVHRPSSASRFRKMVIECRDNT